MNPHYDCSLNPCYTCALERLRRKLGDTVTTATAVFTRTDGTQLSLTNVNPDSIGPAGVNKGIIGVEFDDKSDRIVHLPFIQSWEIIWV